MKKNLRKLLAALLCLAAILTVSCGKQEEEPDPTEGMTNAEISELAMNNFVRKLDAGNFTCGTPDVVVTTAVSPEKVYVAYPHEGYPTVYAYMTLDGETFATMIENNIRYEIEFVSTGNALEAVGTILPNSWYRQTGGNMFEYFYNDPDDPLKFTSNDYNVKYTLGCLGGYGQQALDLMQEVTMTLDAVDPTSVHFTAVVEEYAMYTYDDLDLTITFGNAESEPHIEAWFKNPEYPVVRTEWNAYDLADTNTVFMRGYGAEAVPFPEFASYALIFDESAYDSFRGIRLLDHRATEQDVEDYRKTLLQNGFREVQEQQDDGSTATVYRKLLRERYNAYSELYPSYNDGFELVGIMHYEDPHYEGIGEMSAVAEENGYAPFAETDLFEGWSANNEAGSRSEGLMFFFDYEIYMPFNLTFSDKDAAVAYWDEYCDRLEELGFSDFITFNEGERDLRNADQSKIFKYAFSDDSVRIDVKSEKLLSAAEMKSFLDKYGIPDPELGDDAGGRDQAKYRYELSGFEGLFFTGTKYFANSAEAEAFLDGYTGTLEDNGYYRINPEKIASVRQFLFLNEELWQYVGFDYFPGDEGASILFEFYALDGAEEEQVTLMQSALGH